jgi:hypothetical protein
MEFVTAPEYVIYYIEALDLSGNNKSSEGMVLGDAPPLVELEAPVTERKLWPSQTNPLSYTINIKNNSTVEDKVTLSAKVVEGSPSHTSSYWDIQLPSEVTVPAGSTVSVELVLSGAVGTYAVWDIGLEITATSGVWRLSDSLTITTFIYPDVNFDNKVNIEDLSFVGSKFGMFEGDPGWSPYADVVPDGKINIEDLSKTGLYFGWRR